MTIREFTIPLNKEELLNSHFGRCSIKEIIPINSISREINGISQAQICEKSPSEVIEDKFEVFFSIIVHGNKLESVILLRGFIKVLKLVQISIDQLTRIIEGELTEEDRMIHLNGNKMLAYLLSSMLCIIEDQIADSNSNNVENIGKRKKNIQKSDIEEEWQTYREKALEAVYRWLQMPIKNLWKPPIVEDSFVGTISQMCYKILEKTKDFKSPLVKDQIFQILGILVKKYNHGIACVVRIIHLAKFNESLAAPLGAGVALMATTCGCTGLVNQIVREIVKSEPGDNDARNFSNFLEAITGANTEIVLPVLDSITDFLDNDSYILRNCAIEVMGIIITKALTGEDLAQEKRQLRDECLGYLLDHILDCNAYVRSKVLSTWQRLCCEGAVPLSKQIALLRATVLRLEDKSANVRKQALQLLRAILQSNPFTSQMNHEQFIPKLEQAKTELKQLQTSVYHTVGAEQEKEELWKTQLPLIEKAFDEIEEEAAEGSSENEDENSEEKREVDFKAAYDNIQRWILKDKCLKAVRYLQTLFSECGLAKELKNLAADVKREALLLFMYKIFIYSSQDNASNTQANKNLTNEDELKQLDQIKVKKKIVDYLQNCLTFSKEMEQCLPLVEKLLYSLNPGDGIEACSFLGTAHQFQVPGSLAGVRKALFQIFSKDQSVRDNVALVYKDIYLNANSDQLSGRQRALNSVKALVNLLDGMQPGQSPALCKLITSWRGNNELDAETLKVMWETFSMKLPNTKPDESRSALMLLSMAAQVESNIITDNLDVLIKIGLGERAETDLLLARDTCRAFLNIKQDCSKDIDKVPIKYPNDHVIFERITKLLKATITETRENGYISFATDAINVIFHLADQPDSIIEDILRDVAKTCNWTKVDSDFVEMPSNVGSRLLFLVGHVGIRKMVHLDQTIYKELKRRNAIKEKKKELSNKSMSARHRKSVVNSSTTSIPSSANRSVRNRDISYKKVEDDQDDGLEGATADDMDAEHINHCLENELLANNSYLSKFVPIILHVCQHPEKYKDENLLGQGVTALSKFMTISSSFCESNLQLLVTILERSVYPQIRANILLGLTDLMTRFPNQIEPWTSHIYGRLKDDSLVVRSTCVRMLSNLILGEMIRVKGQVSQLALCLVDKDETIKSDTRQLFRDLSQKGNALYNVMPDILSCLSDSELALPEEDFQEIIKYILGLLQKERQVDSIIEKLCSRFKLATTERQWVDLSYCLSLLKFSAKSIRLLIKDLPLLKDKIHNEYVLRTLNGIIEQTKKRPEAKTACLELEEKIKELVDGNENDSEPQKPPSDSESMPPPPEPPKSVRKKRRGRK